MFCTLRLVAGGLLAAALAAPLFAEPTPAPPEWADAGGSIYSKIKQSPPTSEPAYVPATATDGFAHEAHTPNASEAKADSSVMPAIHQVTEPAPSDRDKRHLAPPTSSRLAARSGSADEPTSGAKAPFRPPMQFGLPLGSVYTVFSALAIVIGAFLILAWLLRRGSRKMSASLPGDVVSVLGRVPLAARQFAHLLRVGNKLVLVTFTPTGAETLTEVTDPVEVDRLVGLCQQFNPHSTTKAFEQVFHQLSRESAPGGFLGDESLPQTISSAAAAYRAHRGGTARG